MRVRVVLLERRSADGTILSLPISSIESDICLCWIFLLFLYIDTSPDRCDVDEMVPSRLRAALLEIRREAWLLIFRLP